MTTLEYLSKRLGTRSFGVKQSNAARIGAVASGSALESETVRTEPLLATHEIELALSRERERLVVLFPGAYPLIVQRTIYHEDPYFLERMT